MTIQFFQPPTEPNKPNLSPFCTKLDMIMQLSGLRFDRQLQMDPREGPKQKVPFIQDDGHKIGDTQFIEAHLMAAHDVDLLAHLSPTDRATGRMIMATVEEQLYFVLVYGRWQVEANWPIMEEIFFGHMPSEIRSDIAIQARQGILRSLFGQGMGRHSEAEVNTLGKRVIDDLAQLLGDNDYFLSNRPTSIDASVYGALVNFAQNPVPTPLRAGLLAHKNLSAYLDRISSQFFANTAEFTKKAA